MNAADYYGLDELKQACSAFIESCITVDTVCALLATAERYIQYKCTKVLVQKVCDVQIGTISIIHREIRRKCLLLCQFHLLCMSSFSIRNFWVWWRKGS